MNIKITYILLWNELKYADVIKIYIVLVWILDIQITKVEMKKENVPVNLTLHETIKPFYE